MNPPPYPPLGDIICEQPFSQKIPTNLEYSFTQQLLSYANSTPEFFEKGPGLWQIVSKIPTASKNCSFEAGKVSL